MGIVKELFKILFILLMFLNMAYALSEDEITSKMREKTNQAVEILANKDLSNEDKNRDIIKIVDPIFDYELMAKLSLSKQWKALSSEQQAIFVKSFEHRLKNSYVDKLDLYTNQKVSIKEQEKVKENRIWLVMEIQGEKEKYEIIYKFYKNKQNDWFIYDLDILGVSVIQTYRSQFEGALQRDGFDKLIEKLNGTESEK